MVWGRLTGCKDIPILASTCEASKFEARLPKSLNYPAPPSGKRLCQSHAEGRWWRGRHGELIPNSATNSQSEAAGFGKPSSWLCREFACTQPLEWTIPGGEAAIILENVELLTEPLQNNLQVVTLLLTNEQLDTLDEAKKRGKINISPHR